MKRLLGFLCLLVLLTGCSATPEAAPEPPHKFAVISLLGGDISWKGAAYPLSKEGDEIPPLDKFLEYNVGLMLAERSPHEALPFQGDRAALNPLPLPADVSAIFKDTGVDRVILITLDTYAEAGGIGFSEVFSSLDRGMVLHAHFTITLLDGLTGEVLDEQSVRKTVVPAESLLDLSYDTMTPAQRRQAAEVWRTMVIKDLTLTLIRWKLID